MLFPASPKTTKTQRLEVKICFVKYTFHYLLQFERGFLSLSWATGTLCDRRAADGAGGRPGAPSAPQHRTGEPGGDGRLAAPGALSPERVAG